MADSVGIPRRIDELMSDINDRKEGSSRLPDSDRHAVTELPESTRRRMSANSDLTVFGATSASTRIDCWSEYPARRKERRRSTVCAYASKFSRVRDSAALRRIPRIAPTTTMSRTTINMSSLRVRATGDRRCSSRFRERDRPSLLSCRRGNPGSQSCRRGPGVRRRRAAM